MKTNRPDYTATAAALKTTLDKVLPRAKALGLTITCRRCGGTGNWGFQARCYDCRGCGGVLAADAQERAEALAASGAVDAYLAAKKAEKAAKESAAADLVARAAADSARCARARARFLAAEAAISRWVDRAFTLGLDDAADLAAEMSVSIRRNYCFRAEAMESKAAMAEALHNAFSSYVLDHDPEVIAAQRFAALCREADSYTTEVTIYA